MQLEVTCRLAASKQMQDLHLLAPKSAGAGLEKAPTRSSLDQALWNEVGAAGKKFLTRGEMGSAVLCALGGVTLSPRDGQTIPSSPWSTEVIPGAALRSVLSLPHKRLKEQCNYARESAALRYENRRG